MDKKKLTGEEAKRILVVYSLGVAVGGLLASCVEVFLIGGFFCLGVFVWSAFKKSPKQNEPPQIVPFNNNHQL